ncbi:MAG: DUF4870 domain-containing protein, partial [Actinomycetota bacterium]|nr:DUF4870 domain-containing protein [Actinomycetota bacterium]
FGPPGPGGGDERTWGMLSHLGALLVNFVTGALGFLVPLIVLMTKGNSSPFVRRHANESLNFNLTALLVGFVGGIVLVLLTVVTLGLGMIVAIPVALAYFAFVVVFQVIATIKANNGEDYSYPLTIRFVR